MLIRQTGRNAYWKQDQWTAVLLLSSFIVQISLEIYHLFIRPKSTEISEVYIYQTVMELYKFQDYSQEICLPDS
jgi:hypothetical protein